jgi:hypothetical protein
MIGASHSFLRLRMKRHSSLKALPFWRNLRPIATLGL